MSFDLAGQHATLIKAFSSASPDLNSIRTQLTKLKIALTEAGLLVPSPQAKPQDLVMARDVLEVGAFWSIRVKDVESFDRYMNLLKAYYTDYA